MILSGKAVADEIKLELKAQIETLPSSPGLAVILVGNNPASESYIKMKRQACQAVGITSFFHPFPESIREDELLEFIQKQNADPKVDGILVQFPLPSHISTEKVIEAIDPNKDVDGFHPINMGKLLLGLKGGFIPCTPLGIKVLLERSHISVEGKDVVIVGRSQIVGKPLAALFLQNTRGCNATVTVIHSKSSHFVEHTKRADILIAAMGSPHFIKADMIKEGAVVVDVGINRLENSLVGDVDFNEVEKKCQAITPVPGGVGPMTVAMLLQNTCSSYIKKLS